MSRTPVRGFAIVIGITVMTLGMYPGNAIAQVEQLKKDIDLAVEGNRSAVETAVAQASKGTWAASARTLLQAMPKANVFQILSGNKQAMERALQYFPDAIQYAGEKVGEHVSLPISSPQDVSQMRQSLDLAVQENRESAKNAVMYAQAGNWGDSVYTLCSIPRVPQDKCVKAFPEAIRYAASKVGQSVAIADPDRSDGASPAVKEPVGTSSTPQPGRTCIREEKTKQTYCGQIIP